MTAVAIDNGHADDQASDDADRDDDPGEMLAFTHGGLGIQGVIYLTDPSICGLSTLSGGLITDRVDSASSQARLRMYSELKR